MLRFGDPPEDLGDPDAHLPVVTHVQIIELAQVKVGALRVGVVPAEERHEEDCIVAAVPLAVPLRFEHDAGNARVPFLSREALFGQEHSAFRGHVAAEFAGEREAESGLVLLRFTLFRMSHGARECEGRKQGEEDGSCPNDAAATGSRSMLRKNASGRAPRLSTKACSISSIGCGGTAS